MEFTASTLREREKCEEDKQCNDRLGNATELNDVKLKFLKAFCDWLDSWQHQKIPNCERFTLSLHSNAALVRIPYNITRILRIFCMNNISLFGQRDCKVI